MFSSINHNRNTFLYFFKLYRKVYSSTYRANGSLKLSACSTSVSIAFEIIRHLECKIPKAHFTVLLAVSLTILPTVVSPIRKMNAKARNDIPVVRYLKEMNNYILNFTNNKKNYITKVLNSTSHNSNLKLIIITSVYISVEKKILRTFNNLT